jgi:hypothetical protein
MQILKTSLAILFVFALALLFIGVVLPAKTKISRSIVVKAPIESVYNEVVELKNWPKWDPWSKKDPSMQIEYSSPSAGKGAFYKWKGNEKVGEGTLSITDCKPNESIDIILAFGMEEDSKVNFTFTPKEEGVEVQWSIEIGEIKNKWTNFFLGGYKYVLLNKLVGIDFEEGLSDLKKNSEK